MQSQKRQPQPDAVCFRFQWQPPWSMVWGDGSCNPKHVEGTKLGVTHQKGAWGVSTTVQEYTCSSNTDSVQEATVYYILIWSAFLTVMEMTFSFLQPEHFIRLQSLPMGQLLAVLESKLTKKLNQFPLLPVLRDYIQKNKLIYGQEVICKYNVLTDQK